MQICLNQIDRFQHCKRYTSRMQISQILSDTVQNHKVGTQPMLFSPSQSGMFLSHTVCNLESLSCLIRSDRCRHRRECRSQMMIGLTQSEKFLNRTTCIELNLEHLILFETCRSHIECIQQMLKCRIQSDMCLHYKVYIGLKRIFQSPFDMILSHTTYILLKL